MLITLVWDMLNYSIQFSCFASGFALWLFVCCFVLVIGFVSWDVYS